MHCNCRNEEVQLELHVVKKTKRETTSSFVGKKSKSNLEGATNFIKNYQLDGELCLLPSQGLERYSEQKMATYTHIARRFLVWAQQPCFFCCRFSFFLFYFPPSSTRLILGAAEKPKISKSKGLTKKPARGQRSAGGREVQLGGVGNFLYLFNKQLN